MERKTKTKMAGHTHGVFERSHHQQDETRRQRWSGMERSCHGCRHGSDTIRRHKVTRYICHRLYLQVNVMYSIYIVIL